VRYGLPDGAQLQDAVTEDYFVGGGKATTSLRYFSEDGTALLSVHPAHLDERGAEGDVDDLAAKILKMSYVPGRTLLI